MSQDQEMDRRHALKLTALTATGLIIIGSPMREAQAQKDKDKDKEALRGSEWVKRRG